jgi:UDP-N-acetylglucosamine--N-acetylmuramyl-(pentapeptide) pyrophosphoryl-undecaprenol N-acetylglucosamine transferase
VEGGRSQRCLIAAGGTAGHVLPALAVADALAERGVEVTFAGSPERVEARLVPEAGYAFDPFRVRGIPRRIGFALAHALSVDARSLFACRAILERRRPHVVVGAGGYVAGPMVVAAWTKRIPAALTEADAHLGLANRLAAPFARRVFTAYPLGLGAKERVVGRPIPARSRADRQDDARRRFELPPDASVVLVLGGSQGARTLNELAVDAWGDQGPAVLHLAGERDFAALRPRVERDDYRLLAFTDEFGAALAAADLVVSRSGGVVWEIAAAGKPAILVPYPHATADHQLKNAEHFEQAGGAVIVRDEAVREQVPVLADSMLADAERLATMAAAMRAAARPGAADDIAEELIALAAVRG